MLLKRVLKLCGLGYGIALLLPALVALVAACAPTGAPVMENSTNLPADTAIYRIEGTVQGDTEEMVRQTKPASGYAFSGGYASYSGPVIDGKTILVVKVSRVTADPARGIEWVQKGQSLAIKCVDTKCITLRPGNFTTFLCRRQYEAMTRSSAEEWDPERLATWEVDYCRMETGVLE